MPLFTVIIPTHSHVATLSWAIRSVLDQSLQSFELIVVGDGAPPEIGHIMADWCARDTRIIFRPNMKGAGYGELHRHRALDLARGSLVAYLGDDDLWLPSHLETLSSLLRDSHFAHTSQATVSPAGKIQVNPGRMDTNYARACLLVLGLHSCSPTVVGHTLDAYCRLPFGWRPKPHDRNSDTHMWQQWLLQQWVKVAYVREITSLHIGSPPRVSMPDKKRGDESEQWFYLSREPGFAEKAMRDALPNWQSRILHRKHEEAILDSLVYGTPCPAEVVAVFAAQFADRSGNYHRSILQRALDAQRNSQFEVAEQLYLIVEGDTLANPELLLQAKYQFNAGDFALTQEILGKISSTDPEIIRQVDILRSRSLS